MHPPLRYLSAALTLRRLHPGIQTKDSTTMLYFSVVENLMFPPGT